ncbi:MAG: cobalamin biosynthesis protein CbiX [Betaproteobacteria bacterium]|nr:cobalamin biosynthesis protein CbiX [Betaproteobacteria bacterium]
MAEPAIVLFAHGARDPAWARPFERIKDLLEKKRPGATVELAFLELMEPPLAETVENLARAGHKAITIAPLFMAQGGHLKNDLPKILAALRAEHPATTITLLPAVGDVDSILASIADWLVGATAP